MQGSEDNTAGSINGGMILAVIAVVGYLGFELYAVHKVGYRMEAPYIYQQYIAANHAFELCGEIKPQAHSRFLKNLNIVQQRAQRELKELNPDEAIFAIDQMITESGDVQIQLVDSIINEKGCQDKEVWKYLRRFEIYSKLNLS
ncbi:MAG: hypothetical protein AAF410_04510 [Pseudomonadota bacterium]